MNEATRLFIEQHRTDDIRQLALRTAPPDIDLKQALQQIAGWQTARHKLPSWAAVEGLCYPPHLNMEQCSSEATAQYKAQLMAKWGGEATTYIDLTGGLGIDFSAASRSFGRRIYVERNEELCQLAHHNFPLLGLDATIMCDDAVQVIAQMEPVTVAFLDPARRDSHGARTYGLADCTPDVTRLMPLLRQKATHVVLKLSPMLDWRKAVGDLGGASEVHLVGTNNECKELLVVIDGRASQHPRLVCACDSVVFDADQATASPAAFATAAIDAASKLRNDAPAPDASAADSAATYLYEPNACVMKGGCFSELAAAFAVRQVAANSHLFVGSQPLQGFPGRQFAIDRHTTMNKQQLRQALSGITHANIAVRNFPLSADALRKKLRLKDGGAHYLFATTLADGTHALFICHKIG